LEQPTENRYLLQKNRKCWPEPTAKYVPVTIKMCNYKDHCNNHECKNPTDLKSTMNPYASKIMPKIGHPMTTKKKPTPKEIVPCTIRKRKNRTGEKT
jgi:hypothetical protein